jgi:peptide/nickel transport system substrate-binding protein
MPWTTDRRSFLKTAGAGLAGAVTAPRFAWAAAGDTLRIRVGADFQVLDPKFMIRELDDIIQRCTQVTLVRLGDMREGNPLRLWAAETLDAADPTRIAFTLREGLTWTGGFGPVTADDVKFSFERIAGSDSAWAYQFEKLTGVEVTGERSGILHLSAPFVPFQVIALPYYAGHIHCRAAVEAVGGRFTTEIPAQCGPYLFDSWMQNHRVTLVRNPGWTGEPQVWQRIEFYIVTDDLAAQLAWEADAFDFTRVAPSGVARLRAAMPEGATLIKAPSTRYTWLTINMNAPPLRDLRVRRAIQYAYDSDAVLAGAYDNLTERATGVIPATSGFARAANLIATRDVGKARALLAEAGAEGLVLNLYTLTDTQSQTIAQIIQASLGEAGIGVEIRPTEEASYWALGSAAAGDTYRTIELVLMNFAGGIDPVENLVWFRPDQIGLYNWSHFNSAEYEALYQASLTETDPARRKAMFNRMEDLMEESGGFVFIAFEPYLAIHDSDLRPVILADGHPDPVGFTRA